MHIIPTATLKTRCKERKLPKDSDKHTRAMSFDVTVECGLDSELTTTQFTAEWLLTGVYTNMTDQITRLLEAFTARRTLVLILCTAAASL